MKVRCFLVDDWHDLWLGRAGRNVGAMVYRHGAMGQPGPQLVVMTPAGPVNLTTCAKKGWTLTGEPPDVTLKPSLNINNGEWHGFLTAGVLVS